MEHYYFHYYNYYYYGEALSRVGLNQRLFPVCPAPRTTSILQVMGTHLHIQAAMHIIMNTSTF